jgi:hypothetical protein
MGTAFCDLEFIKGYRPIDNFRNINIWLAILRNIVLLAVFLLYGSLNKYGCYSGGDDQCSLNNILTIDSHIPYWIALWIASLAVFFLALTSEAFQWILASWPIQFLGKISYMLYLTHEWIIEWCMQDYYHHFR